jgi:hypothetical protein
MKRKKNFPISDSIICEMAKMLAEKFKVDNIKASQGYVEKFRKRHGLKMKHLVGEAGFVDHAIVEKFKDTFISKLKMGYIK